MGAVLVALAAASLSACVSAVGDVPALSEHRAGELFLTHGPATEPAPHDGLVWGGWHDVPHTPNDDRVRTAHRLDAEGRSEQALLHLTSALEEEPMRSDLLEARGALYAALGFLRAAERDLELAAECDSERASAWCALGRVRLALELPRSAAKALRRASGLGDDHFELHLCLARAHRQVGDRDRAFVHYESALTSREPTVDHLVEAASLAATCKPSALRPGDRRSALQWIDRALAMDPESAHAWFIRGLLIDAVSEDGENDAHDVGQAEEALRRAVALAPDHREAWTQLALLLRRQGDPTACAEAAVIALRLEPRTDRRRALRSLLGPEIRTANR